jgi:hypothetical protein
METFDFKAAHSPVAQALLALISELHQHKLVELAVLSTMDGLPLATTTVKASQFAAAAGFLMANAQQTCANLSLIESCQEARVRQVNGRLLICRSFAAGGGHLILAVLLKQNDAYDHLLNHTIDQVQITINQYQAGLPTNEEAR